MNSLEKSSDIDVDRAKWETKVFGAFALIALIAFLLFDDFVFKALSTLILAPCSFIFCFHGLTVLTSKLSSINNRNFQIAVSLFFPLVLSYKFIKNTTNPSIEILLGNITPNLIIIALIILYISFSAGKILMDTKYPFRGYIISAAILFVISWTRSGGATGGEDSHGESFTYLDPKRAKEFAETGLIFTQYWLYVSASYLGLFFGFMKRRNK